MCSPATSGSGGFKTVNMQNDILCTRWPPTASCEIRWLWTPREHTVTFKRAVWVSALHQRTDTGSSNSKVGGVVQTWLVLKSLKCARKLSPASSRRLQPGPLMRGRVEPRFHVVCLTSDSTIRAPRQTWTLFSAAAFCQWFAWLWWAWVNIASCS